MMKTCINSGDLTEQLVIQEPTASTSDTGEKTVTWTARGTVWASVKPQRGREVIKAERLTTEQRILVKMWFHAGLDSTMRLVHGTKIYNIVSVVDVDSRGLVHELVCVVDGT